jgi:hypothetical protein
MHVPGIQPFSGAYSCLIRQSLTSVNHRAHDEHITSEET